MKTLVAEDDRVTQFVGWVLTHRFWFCWDNVPAYGVGRGPQRGDSRSPELAVGRGIP